MKRFAFSLIALNLLAVPTFAQTADKASIDRQLAELREAHNANVAAVKALAADVKELSAKFDRLKAAQTNVMADPFSSMNCVNGVCSVPDSQGKWIGNIWHNSVNGVYVPGLHPANPGAVYGAPVLGRNCAYGRCGIRRR